ncbi:MAG: putative enoyl-CoA hydratase [Betaproteobacteria bacterium]|jgi:enoyl-CoA hydratase/carnithine racemase|nr:putative enoyl-CoA hydratase [Betaproteobacteria bacterium]
MGNEEIGVSVDGHVATVELRRPPNNFLDVDLIANLASVLEALDDETNVRSVVLAAAGKHFCAGANLKKRVDDEAAGKQQAARPRHLYHEAQRLVQTRKPIVAAVHGSAIGAGLGLALVADFRVTCKEARLAANFTALGYHPGFGMTVTLPRLVGHQRAKWLFLTGRRVPGDEAYAMGLADRLVAQDQVRQVAQEMAAQLAKSGPLALQAARETLNLDLVPAFRAATEREMFQQQVLRETNDFKEGVKAGFDRREPVFTGT